MCVHLQAVSSNTCICIASASAVEEEDISPMVTDILQSGGMSVCCAALV
jgi:hypothetical protein